MTTTIDKLGWGARDLVPEEAKAAWGARLIITQSGDVDIVHDRQDVVGVSDDAKTNLLSQLNASSWRENLSNMLKSYQVSTREEAEVVVYENDWIAVKGNSNGSAGYFYIAAWLK